VILDPHPVVGHVEVGRRQHAAVQGAVDLQRAADQARPRAAADAGPRLQRADEDGVGHALIPGDEVEAVVEAVDEVHVGVARRPVHHPRAGGQPAARRVGGQVLRTEVSLDLDQAAPQPAPVHLADQQLAEQIAGNLEGVAREEAGAQRVTAVTAKC